MLKVTPVIILVYFFLELWKIKQEQFEDLKLGITPEFVNISFAFQFEIILIFN